MNDIVDINTDVMPTNYMDGLKQVTSSLPVAVSGDYLTLGKDGVWTHGQARNEILEEDLVAINPLGCTTGWVIWGPDGDPGKKAEIMQPVAAGLCPQPPEHPTGYAWKEQHGLKLKIIAGPDTGTELSYATTSVGGVRAIGEYFQELIAQHNAGEPMVAIAVLRGSSYIHAQYGKIWNPVFDIVEWQEIGEAKVPKKKKAVKYGAPGKARTRTRTTTAAKPKTRTRQKR